MRRFIIFCFFVLANVFVSAQKITRVTITGSGITEMVTVKLNDNAIVNLSLTGNVINYGMEYFSERVSNYSRLENYNGRVEMYAATDDNASAGKVKYIGGTAITYYASYEDESLRGKIKMIGTLAINYYMPYENELEKGKIKNIGSSSFTYYSSFDNADLKGKLKSIGTTNLNYYSSFDDKAFRGKIKSIGYISFTYYSSYEKQFAGAMKTGNVFQNLVAGINFVIT